METLAGLALSLAIGLLLGLERGWQARAEPSGRRVAGIRTFSLIGLAGGLCGVLADDGLGPWPVAAGLLALGALLAVSYLQQVGRQQDLSITTSVAALVAFLLGALAATGLRESAAAAAVVVTWLLSVKPTLHAWLRRIDPEELRATLRLLLISVVVLPFLPNRGYGPGGALNPFEIWWMVVLIAAISWAGYVAARIVGPGRGAILTGLVGGLVSSTAVTLHLSRLCRERSAPATSSAVAAGILAASGMMFARILVEIAVVNPSLLRSALPAFAARTLVLGIAGWWIWHRSPGAGTTGEMRLGNPLELGSAIKFGAFLALVMVLADVLEARYGEAGILALASVSGLADVDAITLSLARMATESISASTASQGIVLAGAVNTVVKGVLATAIGGRHLAGLLWPPLVAALGAGGLVLVVAG